MIRDAQLDGTDVLNVESNPELLGINDKGDKRNATGTQHGKTIRCRPDRFADDCGKETTIKWQCSTTLVGRPGSATTRPLNYRMAYRTPRCTRITMDICQYDRDATMVHCPCKMVIRQRLALAEHVSACTHQHPFDTTFYYTPLQLPTGPHSYLQSTFHLRPAQIKCFAFAAQHRHHVATSGHTRTYIAAYCHRTQLPKHHCISMLPHTHHAHSLAPPTHVLRLLCTDLQGTNIWSDAAALASEPFHT